MIQNVVSTANAKTTLDLNLIASNSTNIEYNPQNFTAAIQRSREPKATFLIFSSGKIVCNGAKTIDDSKKAFENLQNVIQEIYKKHGDGRILGIHDFTIQNIVGSTSTTYKIDLIALHNAFPDKSHYDEIIFPGLRLRPYTNESTTAIIFISGKFFVTGVNTEKKLIDTIEHVKRILLRYKRAFPYEPYEAKRWFNTDEKPKTYYK